MSPASSPAARGGAWRVALLVAAAVAATAVAFALPPVAQDPAYHDFADRRRIWGVPNALNVLSNLPFTVVGALGVSVAWRGGGPAWERAALLALFGGVGLTGFGSAWYHLAPTTATLFWDRLPMTLAFMALLALTLGERVSERAGPWLLPLCLGAGVGSVVHWQLGERAGAGDLRLYALVQFFPVLAIPLLLGRRPPRRGRLVRALEDPRGARRADLRSRRRRQRPHAQAPRRRERGRLAPAHRARLAGSAGGPPDPSMTGVIPPLPGRR